MNKYEIMQIFTYHNQTPYNINRLRVSTILIGIYILRSPNKDLAKAID